MSPRNDIYAAQAVQAVFLRARANRCAHTFATAPFIRPAGPIGPTATTTTTSEVAAGFRWAHVANSRLPAAAVTAAGPIQYFCRAAGHGAQKSANRGCVA